MKPFRHERSTPEDIDTERDRKAPVEFRFSFRGRDALSLAEQESFKAVFKASLAKLDAWCAHENWTPPSVAAFHVHVSDAYEISRALVPSWEGQRGRMEFPTRRVAAGKAAITHELAHVYFPNGNRFLAEGFAVYMQDLLGDNPAFPNFGKPLHEAAGERWREIRSQFTPGAAAALAPVDLAALDATPTPNPLTLAAVRQLCPAEHRAQGVIYAMAGSFVQFLIEIDGLARFRALYDETPLIAGALASGISQRWTDIYGRSLAELEAQWRRWIADVEAPAMALWSP